MKLIGDVPQDHKEIAEKLESLENYFNDPDALSREYSSMAFICLAHDWYELDLEQEGDRLLQKAEEFCPGYYQKYMVKHTIENENFDRIVKSIFSKLIVRLKEAKGL